MVLQQHSFEMWVKVDNYTNSYVVIVLLCQFKYCKTLHAHFSFVRSHQKANIMTEGLEQRARGQVHRSAIILVIKHEQLLLLFVRENNRKTLPARCFYLF